MRLDVVRCSLLAFLHGGRTATVMFLFAYLILVLSKGQIDLWISRGPIASRNVPVARKPNWSWYRATVTYAGDIELFLEFLPWAPFVAAWNVVTRAREFAREWRWTYYVALNFSLREVVANTISFIYVKKRKDDARLFLTALRFIYRESHIKCLPYFISNETQ